MDFELKKPARYLSQRKRFAALTANEKCRARRLSRQIKLLEVVVISDETSEDVKNQAIHCAKVATFILLNTILTPVIVLEQLVNFSRTI